MSGDKNELSIFSEIQGRSLIIQAAGVVALDTSNLLAWALRQAVADASRTVTVDLRRVELMDSSGLALLMEASRCLRSPQTPCAPRILVMPGGQPARILQQGRFDSIMEIIACV